MPVLGISHTSNDRLYEDPGCYDAATLPEEAPKTGANQGIDRHPDTCGNAVHEATLCLEFSQISDPSFCFIKTDPRCIFISAFLLSSTLSRVLLFEKW
jgi:hypothetical protein